MRWRWNWAKFARAYHLREFLRVGLPSTFASRWLCQPSCNIGWQLCLRSALGLSVSAMLIATTAEYVWPDPTLKEVTQSILTNKNAAKDTVHRGEVMRWFPCILLQTETRATRKRENIRKGNLIYFANKHGKNLAREKRFATFRHRLINTHSHHQKEIGRLLFSAKLQLHNGVFRIQMSHARSK